MKFICDKNILSEAIINVLPAVSSKSSLMVLEGIMLECNDNTLTLTAYNLELGIKKDIEVQGLKNGSVVLKASLLSDIINKMGSGNVTFESDEKLLTIIECNSAQFTILGLDSKEFPEMPLIQKDKEFEIKHNVLRKMISQTLFCVSQLENNPIHTGSLFDIKNGCLTLVSVDGYRLALRKEKIDVNEDFKFIVPGKTLSEILKLLTRFTTEDEDDVKISVSSRHISFIVNGYIIISRLIEGEFLDYENALPKTSKTDVIVDKKAFLDSINRASIIINERAKSPIKCDFLEDNKIKLFCETALGKINDSLTAQITGEQVKIGFNNRYMADALKASDCDEIKLEIAGPLSPIKLLPLKQDDFLFLVLPVRL